MSRMYPHTITVWCKLPEKDRQAQWHRHVLTETRWEGSRGANHGSDGDVPADTIDLMISGRMKGWVSPEAIAEGHVLTDGEWTMRQHDRVVKGDVSGDTPPKTAHAINWCEPIELGKRITHWEAGGA